MLRRLKCRAHAAQMLERFQRRTKQDVDAARKNVLAATAELARICTSETLAAGHDTGAAFDANVNRQRMSPTPPRTVPVGFTCAKHCAHGHQPCYIHRQIAWWGADLTQGSGTEGHLALLERASRGEHVISAAM